MTASASMPPTPQPTTPRPLIIVVWLSVPTSVSGMATSPLRVVAEEDALGEELEVDLVHDADARRDDAEVVERFLAPAEKLVALAVALKLEIDVDRERIVGGKAIDLHRVIDHQIDGDQRVDFLRIAAEPLHGAAHGGQIDDAGHAGEILQHDAGGFEGDFDFGGRGSVPSGEVAHVLLGDFVAVAVAQERFEQDANRERQRARSCRCPAASSLQRR